MDLIPIQNSVTVHLNECESFYFKPTLLKGLASYDWAFPPPHPFGSPFIRLYHGLWILKEVRAIEKKEFQIFGNHPRGNFKIVKLAEGEKTCVAMRFLAGFSSDLKSIHTRIRFSPAYWLLHEHFFSVFEGPGTLLLHSASSFEESHHTEFQPERIAAFSAYKEFRPISPQPTKLFSQFINLIFSREVIWQFQEPGKVLAETCSESEVNRKDSFLGQFFKHLLGFLKI
jgi:hypothetical protein